MGCGANQVPQPRQETVEVVKTAFEERISERSEATKVPKISRDTVISCLESVEAGPDLRTVKQHLDTGRESPSRFFERPRERWEQVVAKESEYCAPTFSSHRRTGTGNALMLVEKPRRSRLKT